MTPELLLDVVYGRKRKSADNLVAEREPLLAEMNAHSPAWEADVLNLSDAISVL